MRYTDKKIVVIGVSHGSLIVHSAILKIKAIYTPIDDLINFFKNRIIVLTLGSPKYLPKTLLSNTQQINDEMNMIYGNVYNFYNIKDNIYSILSKIKSLGINSLSYLNFPELSREFNDNSNYISIEDLDKRFNDITHELYPKYKFDTINHIFFVKNTENLKYTKENSPNNNLIRILSKELSSIIFYHSVLFHFFPIFEDNLHIIHYMRKIELNKVSSLDNGGRLIKYYRNDEPLILRGGKKIKKFLKMYKRS
jgi:hypothetical protein